ncbi:hypothetical protein [Tenacibaculum aquimarinum]|uniref:hypothetical protein n=1 Tax=Tenacibaculum aquimarinum TaxID=2910675 RepID=UPI001F0AAC90|nr:hypothetical protein [Tenacibaculum aquimarinum]MCH3883529.1 hypothetical protein [Tenacibaculum aquimarinum]
MVWYARKSSDDGKGMNKGILFNEGEHYSRTEEDAKKYVESLGLDWEEELKTINTKDEWFYFTYWEELDDEEFYDFDGNLYKFCDNYREVVRVLVEMNLCLKCNFYT